MQISQVGKLDTASVRLTLAVKVNTVKTWHIPAFESQRARFGQKLQASHHRKPAGVPVGKHNPQRHQQ